jgi:hypothetical protein
VAKIVLKLWDKFIENNLIGATIFSIVCGIMIMYAGFSLTYIISVYSDDENQRQYFTKGGMLIVLITRDDGYPFYWHFGWKVRRTICFTKIEKIKKRPCSIVIIGNIIVYKSQWKMIYTYDLKATKVKKKYRIPRNFSHEEQILDINIEEYNRKMTKLDIDITDFYVNRKRIPDKYLKAENRR